MRIGQPARHAEQSSTAADAAAPLTRRALLATGVTAAAAAVLASRAMADEPATPAAAGRANPSWGTAAEPFGYCLNTSTIRGANLNVAEQCDVAIKAGYHAVEPWLGDLDKYEKGGGSLKDLGKRLADAGVSVESAIGFAQWIVDDDDRRAKGLEQMKRDMATVAAIGGKRIAAPPIGANDAKAPLLDLHKVAERYRAVLELGDQIGVTPECELWGSSRNLSRLGEAVLVAIESGHPKACVLPDVYHLYKGGSNPLGLRLVSGDAFHAIHFNDYPADPPRETITDAMRIYPGDGIAPTTEILRTLKQIGYRGVLSLELFNRDYWKLSPVKVAQTGLEKMKAAVQKAFA